MASRPTGKKRKGRQKLKEQYAKVREDAQLAGLIATTSEGAVRNEVVDPRTQDEQRFPGLDRMAIRGEGQGWSVPEAVKRRVVEKAAEVLFERKTIWDKDGKEIELPPDRAAEAQAARTLLTADERQWERDHPTEAGKAKGGVTVPVQVNVGLDWAQLTGEKAVDPAEQRLKELDEMISKSLSDEQIENKEAGHEIKADVQAEQEGQADQSVSSEVWGLSEPGVE